MQPKYSRYYTFIKPVLANKSVRTYSFLIFSLITSLIFIIFAIQPTAKTIISLEKSIHEQEDVLKQIKQKSNDLSIGKQNYDNLAPQIKTNLMTMVPQSPALPALIADLSSLANTNQASISGLQFQQTELPPQSKTPTTNPSLGTINFTINVQGSYNSLVNFTAALDIFNHLISIETANFIKPNEGLLIMSITAKAYYLK